MTQSFLEILCSVTHLFRRLFQFVIVLLVLLAFSIVTVEPGTSTYYITIVNLLVLIPLLAASASVIYFCETKRDRKTISSIDSARENDDANEEHRKPE